MSGEASEEMNGSVRYLARQQEAVAELGHLALTDPPLPDLGHAAVEAIADVLGVQYAKVLELLPDGQGLRLMAGVGWQEGLVGQAVVGTGKHSQAGYTLLTDDVVEVVDFAQEFRFAPPDLLVDHDVASGMSVVIQGGDTPWGILGAHAPRPRSFTRDESHFLKSVANILAAAARRQGTEQALRRSEELFRQIAETIESVLWITTPDKAEVEYVSPAYREIWGRPVEEVYRAPAQWLEAIHQEDRPRVEEALSRQPEGNYDVEYRVVRPDGEVRWVRDRAFPLTQGDHGVHRLVGITDDITEDKALESQLRQAQKMEAVGALSGGIAHDFNNRLTVIDGSARLILDELPEHASVRSGVEEILYQTHHAASLTRQLLAFSRRQVLDPQVLDLASLVHKLRPMLERTLPERIELRVDGEESGVAVHADRSGLEQVLLNLVVNAADAIERHGIIRLAVGRERITPERARAHPWRVEPGDYVELRVSDTGPGMPPEVRDRVFEPFFTTKEQDRGTGLGLSMVYGVVKQGGGHIFLDTEPGAGATFRILLPETQESREGAEEPPLKPGQPPGADSGTVLLVEDDRSVQRVLARTLERGGYTALLASTAKEALELGQAQGERVGVVVADVMMPGMEGPELVDRLREAGMDARVILMSGHAEPEVGAEAHRKATAFLNKPFNPEDLLRILERLTGASGPDEGRRRLSS